MARLRRAKGGGDEGRSSWLKKAHPRHHSKQIKIVITPPEMSGSAYPIVSFWEWVGLGCGDWGKGWTKAVSKTFALGEEENFVLKLKEKYGYTIIQDERESDNNPTEPDF
jgi:hypothetical protein